MSVQLVINIVLVVALVGWFGFRQLQWRGFDPERTWRTPLILGVIGLVQLVPIASTLAAADLAALGVELVVSVAVGAAMGRISRIRPAVDQGGSRPAPFEVRTGWWGLALWLVVIAVRVGIDAAAVALGAHAVTATGVILLVFAANRLGRMLVLRVRTAQARVAA